MEYDGDVWWYQLKPEWNKERTNIGVRAFSYMGVSYDYGSLFKNILGRVSSDAKKFFCSEYYYMCLGQTGMAPTPVDLGKMDCFNEGIKICTGNSSENNQEDQKKWGG